MKKRFLLGCLSTFLAVAIIIPALGLVGMSSGSGGSAESVEASEISVLPGLPELPASDSVAISSISKAIEAPLSPERFERLGFRVTRVTDASALPDNIRDAVAEGHVVYRIGIHTYYDESTQMLYGVNGHGLLFIGFDYDDRQNIFVSSKHPWQRVFGYNNVFDYASSFIGLYFTTERFIFTYNDIEWRVQVWKGQYGITSGAEIGLYEKPVSRTAGYYDCVSPEHELVMSFKLYKSNKFYFSRGPERHWWLTGFNLIDATVPSHFTLDAEINFEDQGMCDAFVATIEANKDFARSDAPYDDPVENHFDNPYVFFVNGASVRIIW